MRSVRTVFHRGPCRCRREDLPSEQGLLRGQDLRKRRKHTIKSNNSFPPGSGCKETAVVALAPQLHEAKTSRGTALRTRPLLLGSSGTKSPSICTQHRTKQRTRKNPSQQTRCPSACQVDHLPVRTTNRHLRKRETIVSLCTGSAANAASFWRRLGAPSAHRRPRRAPPKALQPGLSRRLQSQLQTLTLQKTHEACSGASWEAVRRVLDIGEAPHLVT